MKKLLLTTAIVGYCTSLCAEHIIKEVSDDNAKKQNFFSPDKLTIQPCDTVMHSGISPFSKPERILSRKLLINKECNTIYGQLI